MSPPSRGELPIIQASMDLVQWFVPLLNSLPRDQRFALGDHLVHGLYDLLEGDGPAGYSGYNNRRTPNYMTAYRLSIAEKVATQ